jgi:glutamate racemase
MFDSGVGGVSVLRDAHALLPRENFTYFGDNAHAPYGTRTEKEIRALTWRVVLHMLERDVKALVIACNTATSAAAPFLRKHLALPIIGMEPALKPASAYRSYGAILVLATETTLRLPKFQSLMSQYGEGAVPTPCPGLVELIEQGEFDSPALHELLGKILAPYRGTRVGAVVLGCTHYVFARKAIAKHFPTGTPIVDGNQGTARQVSHVLKERGLLRPPLPNGQAGTIAFATSGDAKTVIPFMRKLLRGE